MEQRGCVVLMLPLCEVSRQGAPCSTAFAGWSPGSIPMSSRHVLRGSAAQQEKDGDRDCISARLGNMRRGLSWSQTETTHVPSFTTGVRLEWLTSMTAGLVGVQGAACCSHRAVWRVCPGVLAWTSSRFVLRGNVLSRVAVAPHAPWTVLRELASGVLVCVCCHLEAHLVNGMTWFALYPYTLVLHGRRLCRWLLRYLLSSIWSRVQLARFALLVRKFCPVRTSAPASRARWLQTSVRLSVAESVHLDLFLLHAHCCVTRCLYFLVPFFACVLLIVTSTWKMLLLAVHCTRRSLYASLSVPSPLRVVRSARISLSVHHQSNFVHFLLQRLCQVRVRSLVPRSGVANLGVLGHACDLDTAPRGETDPTVHLAVTR